MTDQAVIGHELVRRGHRVRLVTTDLFHPGLRYPDNRLRERYRGVVIERLRTQISYHWDAVGLGARRMVARAANRADVFHIFGVRHYLEHVAIRMARERGIPALIMPQGSIPPVDRHILQKKTYDAFLERRVIRSADGVIATSGPEFDALVRWGVQPTKLFRLPEFAECLPRATRNREAVRLELGVPPGATLLAWSGRVHPIKGMDLLLTVLAEDKALEKVFLVMMGDDEGDGERARWEGYAGRLGLGDRVIFMGWCNSQTRSNLYGASDAFVLPSMSESFSRAAAESILLGCPLVVADTCGIVRHAAECSLVFRRNPQDLAAKLRRFCFSQELRDRLRHATRIVGLRLKPERMVKELEEIYGARK